MMRKGMSFTLTLLIVALVLLAVGITIITLGQNSISSVGDIFRGNTEDSEGDIARQNCNQERQRICRQRTTELWLHGGLTWATQASHNGRSCYEWADQEQIFGLGGTDRIPSCEQEPSRQEKIEACAEAVREICGDAGDGESYWNTTAGESESLSGLDGEIPVACGNLNRDAVFSSGDTCGDIS